MGLTIFRHTAMRNKVSDATFVTYKVNKFLRDGLSTRIATKLAINDGTNAMERKLKLPTSALREQSDNEKMKALAVRNAVDCKIPRSVFFNFWALGILRCINKLNMYTVKYSLPECCRAWRKREQEESAQDVDHGWT